MLRGTLYAILFFLAVAIIGYGIYRLMNLDPFANASPMVIAERPQYGHPDIQPFAINTGSRDFTVMPLASFNIIGRVLETRGYHTEDFNGDIAPFDVALGWGAMSDRDNLKHMAFQLMGVDGVRYLDWRWRDPDVARSGSILGLPEDVSLRANIHVIPANPDIAEQVSTLRAGQHARLKGYLVQVQQPTNPGWGYWKSSLSLTDVPEKWNAKESTADELMYVTSVEIFR